MSWIHRLDSESRRERARVKSNVVGSRPAARPDAAEGIVVSVTRRPGKSESRRCRLVVPEFSFRVTVCVVGILHLLVLLVAVRVGSNTIDLKLGKQRKIRKPLRKNG